MARRGRGKRKAPKGTAQAMAGRPGALHEQMGIPKGKPIPEAKLEAATNSDDKLKALRARNAMALKGFSHKKAGA